MLVRTNLSPVPTKRNLQNKQNGWRRESPTTSGGERGSDYPIVLFVTNKKSDISDFYFNLQKNIAYGARNAIEPREPPKKLESDRLKFIYGRSTKTVLVLIYL